MLLSVKLQSVNHNKGYQHFIENMQHIVKFSQLFSHTLITLDGINFLNYFQSNMNEQQLMFKGEKHENNSKEESN
jgi:hypothetical protein